MKTHALDIIRDEHQALASMLQSMSMLIALARQTGAAPDFGVLRAMMVYIVEFPERLHHKKESELLFPRLRERAPELTAVLDQLDRDHDAGEKAIRDLEHALLTYEVLGAPRQAAFEQAARRYVDFYLRHMALEENEVLPSARRLFTADDWKELDAAFAAHRDPLTGHEPDEVYRPLFTRIVNTAPAPIGLGAAR
jgi:hemerythrin-like domain-containing protein